MKWFKNKSDKQRLKKLEEENRQLKISLATQLLQNDFLKGKINVKTDHAKVVNNSSDAFHINNSKHSKTNFMWKHYLITGWRNMVRNKAFSVINILGLSLGLACSLLIFLWVKDEMNVNSFSKNKNLYTVYECVFSENKVETMYATPGLLGRELKRNVPEIKYAASYWGAYGTVFTVGDKHIDENGAYADSDFFKMFDYHILEGNGKTALDMPNTIAISKNMAVSLFGSVSNAVDKAVLLNDHDQFKVTAVFDNVPANASEKFDFVGNWDYELKAVGWLYDWINRSPYTYIELQPGADPATVETKMQHFLDTYISNAHYGGGYHLELGIQPFNDMYLHGTFKNGRPAGGRIDYVNLFSIIAVFILLIACINFMNLATARSVKRAKEVGVRKTIGAVRRRLIIQFIGEALMLTFFAILIALFLVIVVLPYFNLLTGKQIIFPYTSVNFWLMIIGLLFVAGFISGSYPALYLSSLNPVKVLKGVLKFSPNALLFRRGLVVFQFVISIVMIIGTIVISKQIHYVQNANLGFDNSNLICIPFQGNLANRYPYFRQKLSQMPGIAEVAMSTQEPSHFGTHVYDLDWEGKNPNNKVIAIHDEVDENFMPMMKYQLVQGRFFSKDIIADTSDREPRLVINETLKKIIGIDNPIGKRIKYFGNWGTIIGVVKDFNLTSLHDPIEPLVFAWKRDWGCSIVKTKPGQTQTAIESAEKLFKEMEPDFPFHYAFVDEEYQQLYASEMTIGKLANCFSFLAVFISCLGLLGLTMFTAEQRRKEIGIRKVLGAHSFDIMKMLSNDILKLIIISAIIAVPVAWLGMHKWLQSYAYRTALSWWIFLMAGVIAVMIALITISWQAIKAARANPVKSLKTE